MISLIKSVSSEGLVPVSLNETSKVPAIDFKQRVRQGDFDERAARERLRDQVHLIEGREQQKSERVPFIRAVVEFFARRPEEALEWMDRSAGLYPFLGALVVYIKATKRVDSIAKHLMQVADLSEAIEGFRKSLHRGKYAWQTTLRGFAMAYCDLGPKLRLASPALWQAFQRFEPWLAEMEKFKENPHDLHMQGWTLVEALPQGTLKTLLLQQKGKPIDAQNFTTNDWGELFKQMQASKAAVILTGIETFNWADWNEEMRAEFLKLMPFLQAPEVTTALLESSQQLRSRHLRKLTRVFPRLANLSLANCSIKSLRAPKSLENLTFPDGSQINTGSKEMLVISSAVTNEDLRALLLRRPSVAVLDLTEASNISVEAFFDEDGHYIELPQLKQIKLRGRKDESYLSNQLFLRSSRPLKGDDQWRKHNEFHPSLQPAEYPTVRVEGIPFKCNPIHLTAISPVLAKLLQNDELVIRDITADLFLEFMYPCEIHEKIDTRRLTTAQLDQLLHLADKLEMDEFRNKCFGALLKQPLTVVELFNLIRWAHVRDLVELCRQVLDCILTLHQYKDLNFQMEIGKFAEEVGIGEFTRKLHKQWIFSLHRLIKHPWSDRVVYAERVQLVDKCLSQIRDPAVAADAIFSYHFQYENDFEGVNRVMALYPHLVPHYKKIPHFMEEVLPLVTAKFQYAPGHPYLSMISALLKTACTNIDKPR